MIAMESSRNYRPSLTNKSVVHSTRLPLLLKRSATQHILRLKQHCIFCFDLLDIYAMALISFLLNCRMY